MTRTRRPSPQTVAVLHALVEAPSTWRYGYELGQQVGLRAGTLYPLLMRLCDRELLEAAWETDPPPGRPARHLYRLTDSGRQLAETTPSPSTSPASPLPARPSELRGAW